MGLASTILANTRDLIANLWLPIVFMLHIAIFLFKNRIKEFDKQGWPWPSWPTATVLFSVWLIVNHFYSTNISSKNQSAYAVQALLTNAFPAILQITASLIGGLWLLWQFNRTHEQREVQFSKQRKQEQDELVEQQKLAREHFDKQQELARDHFATQQASSQQNFDLNNRASEFVDIQNRLAEPEPIIRANAALRLAEFGRTLKPGVPDGSRHTEANNPYFLPPSQQLITALTIEKDSVIREAISEGIRRLTEFAKEHHNSDISNDDSDHLPDYFDTHPLYEKIINQLAQANRRAKNAYIRALSEFCFARNGNDQLTCGDLQLAASISPFCVESEVNIECLKSLVTYGDEYKDGKLVRLGLYRSCCSFKMNVENGISVKPNYDRLSLSVQNLEVSASQLIAIRDSLVDAFIYFIELEDEELVAYYDFDGHIDLNHTFLSGVDCTGAVLKNAMMGGCMLHDSELVGVNFAGAFLIDANFYSTRLDGVDYTDANLKKVNFNKAKCDSGLLNSTKMSGANFESAAFTSCDFINARMKSANLKFADMGNADFGGAILTDANFECAKLIASDFRLSDISKAKFYGAEILSDYNPDDYIEPTLFDEKSLENIVLEPEDEIDRTDERDRLTIELSMYLANT